MAHTIEVAQVTFYPPYHADPVTYYASRVYYPQHPSNAVEFDDATTGLRTVVFGSRIVRHLAVDPGPKSPVYTSRAYYSFWLFWLAVFLGGMWMLR